MNRLKNIIGCGADGFCARLNDTIQEEDPELWNDLSLCPDDPPLPPPIPRVVRISQTAAPPPSEVSLRGFPEMETECLVGERFVNEPLRVFYARVAPQGKDPQQGAQQHHKLPQQQQEEAQDEGTSITVEEFLLGAVKLARHRQEICTSASPPSSSVHSSCVSGSKSDLYRRFNGNEEFDGSSYSSIGKGSASFFACSRRRCFQTSPVYKFSRPATASTSRSTTSVTTVSL